MTTKSSADLTLYDRLSRLTFAQAARFLGHDRSKLPMAGGKHDIDIDAQVERGQRGFKLSIDEATVTLSLDPAAHRRLQWDCNTCDMPCEHSGAALSLILEEKTVLGLPAPPPEREPVERLDDETLARRPAWAWALRPIHEHYLQELTRRLEAPARAEDDWSIATVVRCSCELCQTLTAYLHTPDEIRFEWPVAQDKRAHIHRVIDHQDLPVRHTTRRKGRPIPSSWRIPTPCSSAHWPSACFGKASSSERQANCNVAAVG